MDSRCRFFVLCLLAAGAAALPAASHAQTPPAAAVTSTSPRVQRLRVFLDCHACFSDYLRGEIAWVDFVRQAQDADVHLFASTRETGGGGREYTLRFVGAGRFQGKDRDLRAVSITGDPEELRRQGVFDAVTVGLLGYMAIDGLPAGLELSVKPRETEGGPPPANDPWNLWVYRVGGSGSFQAEESTRETEWRINASADRVTEAWKISFGARLQENTQRFDLDEDEPLKVTRNSRELEGFAVKSLGPHWSIGVDAGVAASDFGNTTFSARAMPAIEFSVFPYREYASRQLAIQYKAGVRHARYNEVTLFGKTRETVGQHQLSADLDQKKKWGSIEFGLEASQYLHDLSKYRLEAQADLSFRIIRGLSVTIEAQASRIRDQISLPLRGATPEEVLLRLRELQSGYQLEFSFGLTYSFGSLFNNVVNPRFGG
ncbi:MAG: hypothetical protein ABIP90_02925 [Vicinamibacterales bacterium]